MKKVIVVRISGRVDIPPKIKKTFDLLNLKKKYSCAILDEKPENIGMLRKIEHYVMYGEIKDEVFKKILISRGKPKLSEKEAGELVKELISGKNTDKIKVKLYFSLHPPRGGFKKSTKLAFPKGILGKNKKINEILLRML